MRVRRALEEVGRPHEVQLVSFEAMKEPARAPGDRFTSGPWFPSSLHREDQVDHAVPLHAYGRLAEQDVV